MEREQLVYVSRLLRRPLLDADGAEIGAIADVVLGPPSPHQPPAVLGFVATIQRRRIFISTARVAEVESSGARLRGGTVDLRHFSLRAGELLANEQVIGRRRGRERVSDLGLQPCANRSGSWEVVTVAFVTSGSLRRRRSPRVVQWSDVTDLFDVGPVAGQVAALRELHPADVARTIRMLSPERRRQLAEVMEDERLADMLEELPEEEQAKILGDLDLDRAAHVLEEMDPDDAVDLLGELSDERKAELLEAMDPEDAGDLRRLLRYDEHTAGGLMTSEPVVLLPNTTVAEALARLRDPELVASHAAQVFVAEPPTQTPTGRYLGVVGFQRLLREPPSSQLGDCVETEPGPLAPDVGEARVAERLAAYNELAVPVCDTVGRLVGAVTIDDVLDRALPKGWRR